MLFTEVIKHVSEQWFWEVMVEGLCFHIWILLIAFSFSGRDIIYISVWHHIVLPFLIGCKGNFTLLQVGRWFTVKTRAV